MIEKQEEPIDQLSAMKALAVTRATVETIEAHREEILRKAIAILQSQGIEVTEAEISEEQLAK